MNITHAVHEEVKGDKLIAIFNRQEELMPKYHDIEKRSGLLQTEDCPVNLNDKRGQARIKDFSWRIMEEIGEAIDAKEKGDIVHFVEEMIDGLHFLTELTILVGYGPKDISFEAKEDEDLLEKLFTDWSIFNGWDINFQEILYEFVMNLGMMCNCLKNKPWKQTNMVTDVNEFYGYLIHVWELYISMLSIELEPDEVVDIYLKKSQVNKFRQRSNY